MIFSNKDLRRLILPLIVEQILAIGVGMIDTMMISQEGDAAQIEFIKYKATTGAKILLFIKY